jgi:hypothetical protein
MAIPASNGERGAMQSAMGITVKSMPQSHPVDSVNPVKKTLALNAAACVASHQ